MTKQEEAYYTEHSAMTTPGRYAGWSADLPSSPDTLAKLVQRNMLHMHWSEAYGVPKSKEQWKEASSRFFETMISVLAQKGWNDFSQEKPYEKRLTGTCRDFSLFMSALCIEAGISARARCGFATYFGSDVTTYEDHWCCEYWNSEKGRWVRYDAQIDGFQSEKLGISFNTADLPDTAFYDGAQAWRLIIEEGKDPDSFGIFEMRGYRFAASNLVRDLAALNKMVLLPWDMWGIMGYPEDETDEAFRFLDTVAKAITDSDDDAIRNLYLDDRLRVPGTIQTFNGKEMEPCTLPVS